MRGRALRETIIPLGRDRATVSKSGTIGGLGGQTFSSFASSAQPCRQASCAAGLGFLTSTVTAPAVRCSCFYRESTSINLFFRWRLTRWTPLRELQYDTIMAKLPMLLSALPVSRARLRWRSRERGDSSSNCLQIRFFILHTLNADAMACPVISGILCHAKGTFLSRYVGPASGRVGIRLGAMQRQASPPLPR